MLDSLETETREARYHRELRRAMRKQDKTRRLDPDRDFRLSMVKFLFVWNERHRLWEPIDFTVRTTKLTCAAVRRWRRRKKVKSNALVRVIDLWELRRHGVGGPPMRYVSTRPDVPFALPLRNS